MALDGSKLGVKSAEFVLDYNWQTLALYALGVGAKRDELDYLYEGRGPKVIPSFAVVPAYPVLTDLMEKSGGNFEMVVHGGQTVRQLAPMPPSGTLKTTGEITGIYDLKRMAQLYFKTISTIDGVAIFETEWMIIFRDGGGFGGDRPPKSENIRVPSDREPDFEISERIGEEQALLYRLSGDTNPLHADPEFAARVGFEQGPILHGLCTFGYACRHIAKGAAAGDATKVREFTGQFKKPVWPGELLTTRGYRDGDRWIIACYAEERAEPILASSFAYVD